MKDGYPMKTKLRVTSTVQNFRKDTRISKRDDDLKERSENQAEALGLNISGIA
jgi:hypothetical protein